MSTSIDRISSLPDEILHHILSFLPMRYAVRTSILSNRWKYLWTFNPNLEFPLDTGFLPQDEEHVNFINHCLDQSNCVSINRLQIEFLTDQDFTFDIENWIRFATSKGVRELFLKIFAGKNHSSLPQFLFFNQQLTELQVSFSIFDLPLDFKGFGLLKVLQLQDVHITDQALQVLLLTCPVLEKVSILKCNGLVDLNISPPNMALKFLEVSRCECLNKLVVDAPNLQSIKYVGQVPILICLQNVPSLMEADVSFGEYLKPQEVRDWTPLLTSFAQVTSLTVRSWFSQMVFAEYLMYRTPHVAFKNLTEFHWSGYLTSRFEVYALVTFFGDCPLLQKLCINIEHRYGLDWYYDYYEMVKKWISSRGGGMKNSSEMKDEERSPQQLDYVLHHLKTIEVVGYSGTKMEMGLVRFLLDKAAALDLLLWTPTSEVTREPHIPNWKLQEHLTRFPKTSIQAKIVQLEPIADI